MTKKEREGRRVARASKQNKVEQEVEHYSQHHIKIVINVINMNNV